MGKAKGRLIAIPLFPTSISYIEHDKSTTESSMVAVVNTPPTAYGAQTARVILCMCPSEDSFIEKVREISENYRKGCGTQFL